MRRKRAEGAILGSSNIHDINRERLKRNDQRNRRIRRVYCQYFHGKDVIFTVKAFPIYLGEIMFINKE